MNNKFPFRKEVILTMRKNSRSIMTMGALGALAGMMLIPALNSKTRKRITRTGRNMYYRAQDLFSDIKDMRK